MKKIYEIFRTMPKGADLCTNLKYIFGPKKQNYNIRNKYYFENNYLPKVIEHLDKHHIPFIQARWKFGKLDKTSVDNELSILNKYQDRIKIISLNNDPIKSPIVIGYDTYNSDTDDNLYLTIKDSTPKEIIKKNFQRIGNSLKILENDELMNIIVEKNILLEICPLEELYRTSKKINLDLIKKYINNIVVGSGLNNKNTNLSMEYLYLYMSGLGLEDFKILTTNANNSTNHKKSFDEWTNNFSTQMARINPEQKLYNYEEYQRLSYLKRKFNGREKYEQLDLIYYDLIEMEHYHNIIKGMKAQTRFASKKINTYLDICCAPGSFSKYISQKIPTATGYGITLPVKKGGLPFLVDIEPSKYNLIWADIITDYDDIKKKLAGIKFDFVVDACHDMTEDKIMFKQNKYFQYYLSFTH